MSTEPPPAVGERSQTTTLPPIPKDYDRLELLYEIQTVLAQPVQIDQCCDALLSIVTRVLRVRTAVLLDTTRQFHRAFMWAAAGVAPVELDEAREHARRMLVYLARGEIDSTHAVSRTALLPGGVAAPAMTPRHLVTLPLSLVRGHVFGVFQLEAAIAFDERDLLFINAVANQLAVALDRHHIQMQLEASRSEVEQANRRLHDLHAISKAAIEGATLDKSLSAVVRAMCAMFATDVAAVLLASADAKTLRRRASIGLDDVREVIPFGSGAVGRIAATGTSMIFDNLDDLDGASPTLSAHGVASMLGAPMRARNHLTGVVYVASRTRRAFSQDELQLLELVADRIGTIIENATLYENALAAIRSRDVVMGIVSHDLRNPLSSIQLCTELLATDDPDLARPLAIIKRSVVVMDRLIGDLKDVASIEAGHLSIKTGSRDARSIVGEAIEAAQAPASEKSIRIETRLTHDLVVECDRDRIIQVLANLMSNAIKFTPPEGSITITLVRADADHACVSVADTGSGIPADDLPHVFDRYWQAERTAHLGMGLGLTIAKGIVEAHHGTISVESRVDHGTTFSFTLPLARGPEIHDDPASITPSRTTGHRVLVVEQDPNARSALAALLDDEGFIVATAADESQALSKVRNLAPEILIVDVDVRGLREFVRNVREVLGDLPVILMSGRDDDAATAQTVPRTSYIRKPLDVDALVSAIHRAFDEQRHSR